MIKKHAAICDVMSGRACRDFPSGRCTRGASCRFSHAAASTRDGAATQHPPPLQQGRCELPDGWVKCTSPDGRKFYHCVLTATSHWHLPQNAPAPRSVPLPAGPQPPSFNPPNFHHVDRHQGFAAAARCAAAPSQPELQGGRQARASLADLAPDDVAALVSPPPCTAAARVMKQLKLQRACFLLTRHAGVWPQP